jgi:hypothetical protein
VEGARRQTLTLPGVLRPELDRRENAAAALRREAMVTSRAVFLKRNERCDGGRTALAISGEKGSSPFQGRTRGRPVHGGVLKTAGPPAGSRVIHREAWALPFRISFDLRRSDEGGVLARDPRRLTVCSRRQAP